jgi:opacity protein-like surface antigen
MSVFDVDSQSSNFGGFMSHLVKTLIITALAVFVLLSMSAFAQTISSDTNLMPKAAKPAKGSASTSGNWMTHRFEISFQGGASLGGNLGHSDFGSCKELVAGGCNESQILGHFQTGTAGIYPLKLAGIREFLRHGGVKPGNGSVFGIRVGMNVNPNWGVEFIYNHSSNALSFTNQGMLDTAIGNFQQVSGGIDKARHLNYQDGAAGAAQGDQNMYLFNVNRNLNPGGRVTPYIGIGLGGESWSTGPNVDLVNQLGNPLFQYSNYVKQSHGSTGFAWDLAAGVKMQVTEHIGIRGDFMNVMSWPDITNRSLTIDQNGLQVAPGGLVPISADRVQKGAFNQAMFTTGVFYSFGGELGRPSSGPAGDRDSMHDRWEVGGDFGFVHGGLLGSTRTKCLSAPGLLAGDGVTTFDGCDLSQDLTHEDNFNGLYADKLIANLPGFLTSGGIKPGNGWGLGARVGFNLTPHWTVEGIYRWSAAKNSWTNLNELNNALVSFYSLNNSNDGTGAPTRSVTFLGKNNKNDGTPAGNQQAFLFNLDYNMQPNNRFVPYIGAGLGAQSWYGGPTVILRQDLTGAFNGVVADYVKKTNQETGFAFDAVLGAKYYMSRHTGLRFEAMDLLSFQDFTHQFKSIDESGTRFGVPGQLAPNSGTLKQDGHVNQIHVTAGFFVTF